MTMAMNEAAWQSWSAETNRRIAKLERFLDPKAQHGLVSVLATVLKDVRAEMLEGDNSIRKGMGLPTIKPCYRVRAGTGATWR
jgi:hypothetical protein